MVKREACRPTEIFKPLEWIRTLDLDDLYILYFSHQNLTNSEISRILGLSVAAIMQRNHNISDAVGFRVFQRIQGRVRVTEAGKSLVKLGHEVVAMLEAYQPEGKTLPTRWKFRPATKRQLAKYDNMDLNDEQFGETDDCGYLGPGV